MIHAACWAHARRKFFQAVELNPKDQAAIGIVARIVELFSIEAQARDHRLSQEERQLARRQKSGPVLEQIKAKSRAHALMRCQRVFWLEPATIP
jgi:hypothetical protein